MASNLVATLNSIVWAAGGVVTVAVVLTVQLRTRPVRLRPPVVLVVLRWVLLAYGLLLIALVADSQAARHPFDLMSGAIVSLMAVLAVGLGIARGAMTRIWLDEEQRAFRRGGGAVIVLWLVSVAAHVGLDWLLNLHRGIGGLSEVTTLAYLVSTIAAQNITVRRRAATLLSPST